MCRESGKGEYFIWGGRAVVSRGKEGISFGEIERSCVVIRGKEDILFGEVE